MTGPADHRREEPVGFFEALRLGQAHPHQTEEADHVRVLAVHEELGHLDDRLEPGGGGGVGGVALEVAQRHGGLDHGGRIVGRGQPEGVPCHIERAPHVARHDGGERGVADEPGRQARVVRLERPGDAEEAIAGDPRPSGPQLDLPEQHPRQGLLVRGLGGSDGLVEDRGRLVDPVDHPRCVARLEQSGEAVGPPRRQAGGHEEPLGGDGGGAPAPGGRSHLREGGRGHLVGTGRRRRQLPRARLELAGLLMGGGQRAVGDPELGGLRHRQRAGPKERMGERGAAPDPHDDGCILGGFEVDQAEPEPTERVRERGR